MREQLSRLFVGAGALALLVYTGAATAQYPNVPEGVKTGVAPQLSRAGVTLIIPQVVGVDVESNFVLDLGNLATCSGTGSSLIFPPTPGGGNQVYVFASSAAVVNISTTDVACAGAVATSGVIRVFSTYTSTSTLRAQLSNGGFGSVPANTFAGTLGIPATSFSLAMDAAQTCGTGGAIAGPFAFAAYATNITETAAIPATGWSTCNQWLRLTLTDTQLVSAGTATGVLTYTMTNP